jgi:hypothetical protein
VISSGKRTLPGHERRFTFLRWLRRSRLGKHIDFFGTGFAPIADKWQAIEPYDFHIAIENSRVPNYWSEKISDAYLGLSLPLYFGCPNIGEYFSPESFREIDITNYARAAEVIERALDAPPSNDELNAMGHARDLVLDRFNIFAVLSDIATTQADSMADVTLLGPQQLPRTLSSRVGGRLDRDWRRLAVVGSAALQGAQNGG